MTWAERPRESQVAGAKFIGHRRAGFQKRFCSGSVVFYSVIYGLLRQGCISMKCFGEAYLHGLGAGSCTW